MSTDRELLALAAKAVGINCRWWKVKQWKERETRAGKCRYLCGTKEIFGTHYAKPWNPLDNFIDTMELVVKLRMELVVRADYVSVTGDYGPLSEMIKEDAGKATRRAVVRAAAEIGEAMP